MGESTKWRSFNQARKYALSLNLKARVQWEQWCKALLRGKGLRPVDIPSRPNEIYAYKYKGWIGWGYFLGTGRKRYGKKHWRSFASARKFVRSLNLKGCVEWQQWCKGGLPGRESRPVNIPSHPSEVYKDKGWTCWGDFMGTGRTKYGKKSWRSFGSARKFTLSLSLKGQKEWYRWCRNILPGKPSRPKNIPVNPDSVYNNKGWTSWTDFLGTKNTSGLYRKWRSFKQAHRFVRSMKLKNQLEWNQWCKSKLSGKPSRPMDIPLSPQNVYRNKGWAGWADWLGTKRRCTAISS